MIDALVQIVLTFAGLVGLAGAWFGLQALFSRVAPELVRGEDYMKGRWGCGGCAGGACDTSPGPVTPA